MSDQTPPSDPQNPPSSDGPPAYGSVPPPAGGFPPPPAGGQPGYAQPQPSGGNQKAVWALVTGILGLLCCGPAGIAAIVLGKQAKDEIAASGGAQTGGGMAQAGFVLGIIAVVVWILVVILNLAGIATFGFSDMS